jgi:hypothetical protein
MKNVVFASLLAAAAGSVGQPCFAQLGTGQQPGGQIQMSADEYAAYNSCLTPTSAAAKAPACEAYLKAYPNSVVKSDALQQLMFAYSQANDTAHTLDAADRLLQVDPNNLRGLTFEVYLRRTAADQNTDPTAKAAALDKVAAYAQTGLNAPKPKDMAQADFDGLKKQAMPTFESAIADDDMAKKDNAGAIAALKAEIDGDPDDTKKPSPVLQDVYTLAQAYYTSTPPDYLNCAWYAARAAAYAPDAFKPQIEPIASYCYKKYHGSADGYDLLKTAVLTNLDPPSTFTVTPAPKPEDIVANLIATTPDLAALAISDREFVLQYGKQADADKAFDAVKGKTVELPDVLVIAATADQVQVAVSDDAVQSKTADFSFNMKEPLKVIPAVGSKVTLTGTYGSYTQKPILITMTDSEVVVPKKAPTKAPARRPTHR